MLKVFCTGAVRFAESGSRAKLKVWRNRRADRLEKGVVQLGEHLAKLGLGSGY